MSIKTRIDQAIDENIRQPIQVATIIAIAALIMAGFALMKAGK